MPRSTTNAERLAIASPRSITHLRAFVADHTGTLREYGNVNNADYRMSAQVVSAVDQVCDTCTLTLRSGIGAGSIAPAMSSSTLNAIGRGIDARRRVIIEVAVMEYGQVPVEGSWRRIFYGTCDKVITRNDGNTLQLLCRDDVAYLLNAIYLTAGNVGNGSSPLETVLESAIFSTLGGAFSTIVTPTSPNWAPAAVPVRFGDELWAVLTRLVDQVGWLLRRRFAGSANELRLFDPRRSMATADWSISVDEVQRLNTFDYDGTAIRNNIVVRWNNNGTVASEFAADTASQTAYGVLPLVIQEGSTSSIQSSAAALRMAQAILADTKTPPLACEIQHTSIFWPAETGDIIDLAPDGITHDATQRLAVIAVTHDIGGGESRTSLTLRGSPVSKGRGWLELGVPDLSLPPTIALPPQVLCRIVASTATTVTVEALNVPAGGTVRYEGGTATRTAGPAQGVDSPEGTQWTFARAAFRTGDLEALFSGTRNGQTDFDSVTISEVGRDTAPILASVRVMSETYDTATVRVSASTLNSSNAAGLSGKAVLVQRQGATITDIATATVWEENAERGLQIARDHNYYGAISGGFAISFIDFLVTKPAPNTASARITFRVDDLSGNNLVSDSDSVDINAQAALASYRIEVNAVLVSGADVTVRARFYFPDGQQITGALSSGAADLLVRAAPANNGAITESAVAWSWDAGTTLHSATYTRAENDALAGTMRLVENTGVGAARTEVPIYLPTYTLTPWINGFLNVPTTFGPITYGIAPMNAPPGATYDVTTISDTGGTTMQGSISNGTAVSPTVNGRLFPSAPHTVARQIRATFQMKNSGGVVVASQAVGPITYYTT